MNIAVLAPSLNAGGGSERVCLDIIAALKAKGHNIHLGTFEEPDWGKIETCFGKVVKPDRTTTKSRTFGKTAYGETLNFHFLFLKMSKNHDATIVSTSSPWFYCPSSKRTIVYMIPPLGYDKGFLKFYLKPYVLMQNRKVNNVKDKTLYTNSSFSAEKINDLYCFKPQVFYPPVDLESFHPSKKEELIVSTGRFNPFKRFEVLIESLPSLDVDKCIIIGNIDREHTRQSVAYMKKLQSITDKLKLRGKIDFFVNCPFSLLKQTLAKARLYVHCAKDEHFGISVVEGMSSGCVPIVHRTGGAYTDIVDHDKYGYSFEDSKELGEKINLLLNNQELCEESGRKAIERSKVFSREVFKKRVQQIVEDDASSSKNRVQSSSDSIQ